MAANVSKRLGQALKINSQSRLKQLTDGIVELIRLTPQARTTAVTGSVDWSQLTNIPIAAAPWTPADNSGAGLVFAGVSAHYSTVGSLVVARAAFTYPATASGAPASISGLPFALDGNESSRQGFVTFHNSAVNPLFFLPAAGVATGAFFTAAGAAVTNAQLTGALIHLTAVYQQ